MRKKRILNLVLALAAVYFLTSCGNPGPGEETIQNAGPGEETAQNPGAGEKAPDSFGGEAGSGVEAEEEAPLVADVEVSDQKVTVSYTGEPFAKSLFAVGGEMLWLYGVKEDGSYFLGYMGKEEDVLRETDVKPGGDMRAFNMTVDSQGRCHILWMSVQKETRDGHEFDRITYERSCITIVDINGEAETEIEVSSIFSEEQPRPYCFAVDRAGNYYFEKGTQLIQILPDGSQGGSFPCSSWIYGVGTGKSGSVYCSSEKEDGTCILEKLEGGELRPCGAGLPRANAIYAGIYAGTDTELLLINKDSGVFAVRDDDSVENRVSGTELPVTGEAMAGYGILADGRACLLGQKEEGMVFYYVPAGK